MNETRTESCKNVAERIIGRLENAEKGGENISGILAGLRKSVGREPADAADVWSFLLPYFPEKFLSQGSKYNGQNSQMFTPQENSILTALQLYALSRQGSVRNVINDSGYKYNIGRSLSEGRKFQSDSKALDKRFNAMTVSENFETMVYRLRQLFKLVKSQTVMTVNFGRLAEDLFWYQAGKSDEIRFRWAEGYYGNYDNELKDNENNQEDKNNE